MVCWKKIANAIRLNNQNVNSNIPLGAVAFYKIPSGQMFTFIENQKEKDLTLRAGFDKVANGEWQDICVQMLLYPHFILYNTAPNPGVYAGQTVVTITY